MLNELALAGWTGVLLHATFGTTLSPDLIYGIVFLESICVVEVTRIALGTARGNLAMGVAVHATRLLMTTVLPTVAHSRAARLVVLAWAATEVCRYPMFLRPRSAKLRALRYLAPVLTFPVGAVAEALCAYTALSTRIPLRPLVALVVPGNLVGGPLVYWAIVKRAAALATA